MKLLVSISDISMDPAVLDLENIGYSLGVMNMRDVFLLVEPYMAADGQSVMFNITQENAFDTARLFFALAVINLASYMYDEFSVPCMEPDMAQRLVRKHTREVHAASMGKWLLEVKRIVTRYGLSKYSAGN